MVCHRPWLPWRSGIPESLDKVKEIDKVAKKMGDNFSYTLFMSPYGNEVHPFSSQGRIIIQASGGMIINALEGKHQKTKPLTVKTSFTFTNANGYLICGHTALTNPPLKS